MGDQLAPIKATLVNFVVKYVKKLVPKYHLPGAISFRHVLEVGETLNYQRPTVSNDDLAFLQEHHAAAMITNGNDGMPKAVRVGIALVDGEIWSSGRLDRVRTRRLRADPRCTLFVVDPAYAYLTLETIVTILDGPDAPEHSVRLFRVMQGMPTGPLTWYGQELDEEAFRQTMADEGRLIYRFDVQRAYGLR